MTFSYSPFVSTVSMVDRFSGAPERCCLPAFFQDENREYNEPSPNEPYQRQR
jgi:hypothetical protein